MKFVVKNADGTKSIDCKINRLLKYVNGSLATMGNNWNEEEKTKWARDVIELGVKNIAGQVFAARIE